VNTGKVYLVHRDFPLPMHAHSRVAASYSVRRRILESANRSSRHVSRTRKVGSDGDVKGTVATCSRLRK